MNKKTLTGFAAAFFAAATAVAAANTNLSVQSAKTGPAETFESAGKLNGGVCTTDHKAVMVTVDAQISASDYEALVKSALPKEMWDLSDEDKDAYIEKLPKDQQAAIIKAYQEKVGAFMESFQSGTSAAVKATFEPATDKQTQALDVAKATGSFKDNFQMAADGIEATGVSVKYDLSIVAVPEHDKDCAAPAPAGPGGP